MDNFAATVMINAKPIHVWRALTDPEIMAQWMGEPEMNITIQTDWNIHATILIRGFHHLKFENTGIVLHYEKEKRLSYTHLSSTSGLPDRPGNYCLLDFILTPTDLRTQLSLSISNFPTETIRRHLEFYWRTTIVTIKNCVEDLTAKSSTGAKQS